MYHIAYKALKTHFEFIFQQTASTLCLTVSNTANDHMDSLAVGGQGEDSDAANASA